MSTEASQGGNASKPTATDAALMLLRSARGWELDRTIRQCEHVYLNPPGTNTSSPYLLRVQIRDDLCDSLLEPLDVRGSVPAQLADRFKALSAHFYLLAQKVKTIEATDFDLKPQAYVARHSETHEAIAAGLSLDWIYDRWHAYSEIMHESVILQTEPLENHPDLQAQADAALTWIREAHASGETNELIEDLLKMHDGSKPAE